MSGASKYITAVTGLLALSMAAVPQVTKPTFKRLAGLGGHPHAGGRPRRKAADPKSRPYIGTIQDIGGHCLRP